MNDWLGKEHDAIPVVANLQCDFLQQVYFGEQLHIGVKVAHIGNSSVDLHYVGKNKMERLHLQGVGRWCKCQNDRKRSRLGRKRTCAIS